MATEIHAVYAGSKRVDVTHQSSGATLRTEASTSDGGTAASFSPTDLVATALGTCVLTIIGLVAERHGIDVAGASVQVTTKMIARPVRRIGTLRTVVSVPKSAVAEPSMRTRMEAAARKCPIHQSLHPEIEAPIEFIYE